ncbi:MAG TPA: bifunctional 5,10-methylenetetrahydrofolate dehydrogenase/5,10-methenyltetrahydrofolate cyclohydrolase [Candidatus Saccharibacteria bacterium]|nr:bifunctional 5,10-methylenetetrahydrofolate dehydrogenase/5,10-methenyltetrahydrofolate cyclohydrolase [Candidatus Saccharibacteria bacterium]
MKLLDGSELAAYIKERQAKQVRGLRQAWQVFPKLAIVQTSDSPVIATYVRLKRVYGEDILIDVELHTVSEDEALAWIDELNHDETVHGIIIQLPLADESRTDELLRAVSPEKDVDALASGKYFDAATPMAINWLLAGYNIDLQSKKIVLVGEGRLVGAPLAQMWQNSGYDVTVVSEPTENLKTVIQTADVVVTATGVPGLITSEMLRPETVVVDAGTASEGGKIVGDVAPDVRKRHDLVITPEKGGVGPLTICALFDNVIRSARRVATQQDQAST